MIWGEKMKVEVYENGKQGDFITSLCNRKAENLCLTVANDAGDYGTLLFVHGPSPCGKTHLLNETAKYYRAEHHRDAMIVSFRHMTDDFIKSIKSNDSVEFMNKYTSSSLLLVDDAECVMGLLSTQQVFADVFRKLVLRGVSIILFSEYKLNYYESLFAELRKAPFLIKTAMKRPDFYLRSKVLRRILHQENVEISGRIFRHIVSDKNIEIGSFGGCVSKIRLMNTLEKEKISDRTIIRILKEYER